MPSILIPPADKEPGVTLQARPDNAPSIIERQWPKDLYAPLACSLTRVQYHEQAMLVDTSVRKAPYAGARPAISTSLREVKAVLRSFTRRRTLYSNASSNLLSLWLASQLCNQIVD